jgi:rod shape determining protein RodA
MTTNLNIKSKFLIIFIFLTVFVGSISLIYFDVVDIPEYQMERIRVYPDHLFLSDTNHSGLGYQVDQSLIAIGSGGFFGSGLGKGLQTQLNFLPEPETDFIFSSISEELGVFGVLIILSLYVFVIWRIYMISTLNLSSAIYFTIVGIICMISFHIIQNIGMNIGLLPVTGIPMPFISAGGSFLIVCFASIALVEGICLNTKT